MPGRAVSCRSGTVHPAYLPRRAGCRSYVPNGTAFWGERMTKVRDPLSIEQALRDVIDAITMPRAAEVTGRTPGYLRELSDPDKRGDLTCRDAVLLDAEHELLLGNRPITDTLKLKLDARRADLEIGQMMLFEATLDVVREDGDAHVALIAATAPGATPAMRSTALREVLQSLNAKRRIIPMLRALTRRQPQAP